MKKVLKWIGISFGALTLSILLFFVSLRFNDGPVEFWPWFTISIGGPFKTGELAPTPADWNFLKDRQEIQMQSLNPTTSRTVWLSVYDGRLFIVSGYMNTGIGRLWKQWPVDIEQDDRVILRVDGTLYEQRMQRIQQGAEIVPVMTELGRKYGGGGPGSELAVTAGFVWMFELLPRE